MAGTVLFTIDELQQYLIGVSKRADHHAGKVGEVVLAIAGCVVLFKEEHSEIRVMAHHGETKNAMWVVLGGERYALSYNHDDETVEVRRKSMQGDVLESLDNESATADVIDLFQRLSKLGGRGAQSIVK